MDHWMQPGFRLGDCEIRPLQGEVTGPQGVHRVHPKVMEVLVCLVRKAGEVVLRDEILDQVWGHHHGSDKSLTRSVSELRQALSEAGGNRLIETIPKRGYRLLASISKLQATKPVNPADLRDGKPSIAVLPFTNMSGDPEQGYFSDGITEDIITELSRIPDLFVVARNSTFTFKDKHATIQQVSRELGARYVVEGSVRKSGNQVRITAQLIDGLDGRHLWAERYDRDLTDIFAVQDEVTRQVVSVLSVTLTTKQEKRVQQPTHSMEAYEYILRGRALAWLHHRESVVEARRLLARAIWLDPSYASAYSWLAFAHSIEFINEWTDSPIETRRVGYDLARKAVELDGTDAQAHFVLGEYHLWAESDHQSAIGAANRAQQLEPNYSHAHLLLGHALHYEGKPEESLGPFKHAMRLDPCFPDLYLHFLAQSYYNLQRYEDAIEALEERLSRNPHTDISRVLLAACYGQTGRLDEARSAWHEALAFNPNYSVEQRRRILPYKNPADFERMVEGLHSAGLPT